MSRHVTSRKMGQQGEAKPVVQQQEVEVLVVQAEAKVVMKDLGRRQMGKIRDMQRC